jgi:hypothetical protein
MLDERADSTRSWIAILVLACACAVPAGADDLPEWLESLTISGYVFGDAYYFVEHDDPEIEGQNGFWFRRIYLTVDSKLSESLATRLRFEVNSPGDFTDSFNLEPYVKNAYLEWKHAGHRLYLGISGVPTFEVVESVWGYRSIEKTPLDLQRLGPSADFGVALKGALDSGERFTYHAMLSNGSGTRNEVDSGKKGMLAVAFHPSERFTIEAYGDVESRPGETDRWTAQLFGGYQGEQARGGIQLARQQQEIATGGEREIDLASAFGVFALAERLSLFARYDHMFDPNPEGAQIPYLPFDPNAASQLVIVGLDFELHEKLNLMPNVEAVFYDEVDGERPDQTLVPRLTFYWRL